MEINLIKKENKPDIRELTLKNGLRYPSDEELLMLILGRGTKKTPVEKLSEKVLSTINSSNEENLIFNLTTIDGVGKTRALLIAASLELGRRRNCYLKAKINQPYDIIPFVKHFSMESTEHFVTATLNGARELLNIRVISVGTINKTLVHPREIFAEPVAEHASGIICCHNHPFGACVPSGADLESTKMLVKASRILGINFLDHIILTKDSYFSFLEHGLIPEPLE